MKKVPLRKCTGCGEMKPKRELIRVVKAPERRAGDGSLIDAGGVSLRSAECFSLARKARRFERSLSCQIPDEVYDEMEKELSES